MNTATGSPHQSTSSLAGRTAPSAALIAHCPERVRGPLNYAQQRLWYLYQLDTARHQHNLVITMGLHGSIEAPVLNRAINDLLERHCALRSRIEGAGRGEQVVLPVPRVQLVEQDLSTLSPAAREIAVKNYQQQELQQPFDLTRSTTPRWQLFKSAADHYQLAMTIHHIVFDGWSGAIIVKGLAQGYAHHYHKLRPTGQRSTQGQEQPPLQSIDYAIWERLPETQESWRPSLAFWQAHLQGYPQHIELPVSDHSAREASSVGFTLENAHLRKLQAWARKQRQPLFIVLKAAFDLILFHHCRQPRFLVGTDIAGRTHPQLADTVGFFINQLPLPSHIDPQLSVATWLTCTGRDTRLALDHRHTPFDRLVSTLADDRQRQHTPLFQVKMNYQKRRLKQLPFGPAILDEPRVQQHLSHFYVVLDLVHDEHGLQAEWEYQRRFFSPQKVQTLAQLWQRLLQGFDVLLDGSLADADAQLAQWSREILSARQQAETQHQHSTLRRRRRRSAALQSSTPTESNQ